jgi:hypothetical protein
MLQQPRGGYAGDLPSLRVHARDAMPMTTTTPTPDAARRARPHTAGETMPIPYLNGLPWTTWSREERLFCAVLYEHARRCPGEFAAWLIESTGLNIPSAGDWDLGFEVCLYRDFLWQQPGLTAKGSGLSAKRTFDLCLFGETSIIIIEAKVCGGFETEQLANIGKDVAQIRRLPGMQDLNVLLVALASARYLANARDETLGTFNRRHVSWQQLFEHFPEPLFEQADKMYAGKRGELLGRTA